MFGKNYLHAIVRLFLLPFIPIKFLNIFNVLFQ